MVMSEATRASRSEENAQLSEHLRTEWGMDIPPHDIGHLIYAFVTDRDLWEQLTRRVEEQHREYVAERMAEEGN